MSDERPNIYLVPAFTDDPPAVPAGSTDRFGAPEDWFDGIDASQINWSFTTEPQFESTEVDSESGGHDETERQ